ncbi:hypothetical protein V5R04_05790 [Jonesiaceae bacterium BS-20]|uniref:Uncharacterized protein n=1 Tax=Jonesiaceae bacterium BS-20 TaxID=3120821 RepID=A0AAU7E068_9MICO
MIIFLRVMGTVNLIFGLVLLFGQNRSLPPGAAMDGTTFITDSLGSLLWLGSSVLLFYGAAKRSKASKDD